jgi:hypothetical protein
MPMPVYKVAFTPKLGVFLGFSELGNSPVWSIRDKSAKIGDIKGRPAPTFLDKDMLDKYLKSAGVGPEDFPKDVELREVYTSNGPNAPATSDDCKNSGLPGWGD